MSKNAYELIMIEIHRALLSQKYQFNHGILKDAGSKPLPQVLSIKVTIHQVQVSIFLRIEVVPIKGSSF